jgi:hypothetical protein
MTSGNRAGQLTWRFYASLNGAHRVDYRPTAVPPYRRTAYRTQCLESTVFRGR